MNILRNTSAILSAAVFASLASAQVVINEQSYDDSSGDDLEFVELYNAGSMAVDISGWSVSNEDTGGLQSQSPVMIPMGTSLNPGAFYVVGGVNVPNVDLTVTNNWLENSGEITYLSDAGGIVVDALSYEQEFSQPRTDIREGVGFLSAQALSETSNFSSLSRYVDGRDTNDNNVDFTYRIATPGASNVPALTLPLSNDFNSGTLNGVNYGPAFVAPVPFVPTTPSQDGGNVISIPDPSGGGNTLHLQTNDVTNVEIDLEVNITAGSTLLDGGQSWTIGVRGHAGRFGHPFDIPEQENAADSYYAAVPVSARLEGFSGIAVSYYEVFGGYSRLYLVDYKNAATSLTGGAPDILGRIDIVPGVNDGWQDLSLSVQGENVVLEFGGEKIVARTDYVVSGGVYFAYREAMSDNSGISFEIDDLEIRELPGDIFSIGGGNPNSLGNVPALGLGGVLEQAPAAVNSAELILQDCEAFSPAVFVVGVFPSPVIGGLSIPGAGAFLLQMDAIFQNGPLFTFANNDGIANITVLIPAASTFNLSGLGAFVQGAELDGGLGLPLPLAGSDGLRVQL